MTAYEVLTGEKPKVDTLRVFSCLAFAHVARDERQKFDFKSKRCILLRYVATIKAILLYDVKQKLFHSRNVFFGESKFNIREAKVSAAEKGVPVACATDTEDKV